MNRRLTTIYGIITRSLSARYNSSLSPCRMEVWVAKVICLAILLLLTCVFGMVPRFLRTTGNEKYLSIANCVAGDNAGIFLNSSFNPLLYSSFNRHDVGWYHYFVVDSNCLNLTTYGAMIKDVRKFVPIFYPYPLVRLCPYFQTPFPPPGRPHFLKINIVA